MAVDRAVTEATLERLPSTDLLAEFSAREEGDAVSAWWLGQAGFCIRWRDLRIAVDPYLSDSLARKYAGTRFPHRRMMAAPVQPEQLTQLDYVFCTHAHTDHMDGDTLSAIARANSRCRFVVPLAERAKALERGVPADRMITVRAGDELPIGPGASLAVVPAAHEERRSDADGNDLYLGYVFKLGDRSLYHPGDCVPFDGLEDWLRPHRIELALLPVNGRDAVRASNGVPGNFHLQEAVELCCAVGIGRMLGHHYGMFDFNTVQPEDSEREIARMKPVCGASLVRAATRYVLTVAPANA
ncbi:MBL fold metallo-hydrolase [Variovorax robiniae]|uniref:MBL fold metallo-hydrolase n=1 Tax=Variovorax robiniae TaxID=1836199 RepID=A0ABU8XIU7_9BURK